MVQNLDSSFSFSPGSPFLRELLLFPDPILQIFHIFLQAENRKVRDIRQDKFFDRLSRELRDGICKKLKKDAEIIGVGDSRPGGGPRFNCPEKAAAKRRELLKEPAEL